MASSTRKIVLLPGPAGERALLARLLAGEEQAYRDCYETHAPRVLALLVRILRDRGKAEEILQETFAAVFKKIGQYRAEASFRTWIGGIAIRRALNAVRDDSRRIPAAAFSDESPIDAGEELQLLRRDLARRLLVLVDRLQSDKRIVILLHAEGYSAAEIASMIKAPRATVLSRLARARAELLTLAAQAGMTDALNDGVADGATDDEGAGVAERTRG